MDKLSLRVTTGCILTICHSVSINGSQSANCTLDYGLPQGSIVGHLWFTVYTIPIGRIIQKHGLSYHLYEYDVQLYISFDHLVICLLIQLSPNLPSTLVISKVRWLVICLNWTMTKLNVLLLCHLSTNAACLLLNSTLVIQWLNLLRPCVI